MSAHAIFHFFDNPQDTSIALSKLILTQKKVGVIFPPPPPPYGFSKNVSSKESVKPWFFVTLNVIKFHWNSSSRSQDTKTVSVNITYFHQ